MGAKLTVMCLDNGGYENLLTKQGIYVAVAEGSGYYSLIDNSGVQRKYRTRRFKLFGDNETEEEEKGWNEEEVEEKVAKKLYDKYADKTKQFVGKTLGEYVREYGGEALVGVKYHTIDMPRVIKEVVFVDGNQAVSKSDKLNCWIWQDKPLSTLIVDDYPSEESGWDGLSETDKHYWLEDAREVIEEM